MSAALDWLFAWRTGTLQAIATASTKKGSSKNGGRYQSRRDELLDDLGRIEKLLILEERREQANLPPSFRCNLLPDQLQVLDVLMRDGSLVRIDETTWQPLCDCFSIRAETVAVLRRRMLVEDVAGVCVLTRRGRQRALLGTEWR